MKKELIKFAILNNYFEICKSKGKEFFHKFKIIRLRFKSRCKSWEFLERNKYKNEHNR